MCDAEIAAINFLKVEARVLEIPIAPKLDVRPHHLNGVKVEFLVIGSYADYPHVGPINLERTANGLAGSNLKVAAVVLQPVKIKQALIYQF